MLVIQDDVLKNRSILQASQEQLTINFGKGKYVFVVVFLLNYRTEIPSN